MMPVDALSPGKSQTASSPLPKKSLYTHLFLFFFLQISKNCLFVWKFKPPSEAKLQTNDIECEI